MPVPIHLAVLRPIRRIIGATLLLTAMAFGYVRPRPDLRIPLDSLGFQPLTQKFLLAGSSMLTLDFVDNQHLLLTFETRALLKRIPGDPPDDEDRNIRALLLELPAGRVLARADWRLHDRGQYLWNLGHGHFLLRIRNTLTTLAPLANLSTPEPFSQHPFLQVRDRRIGALMLTPEADLLTLETKSQASPATSDSALPVPTPDPDTVQVNFYRIDLPDNPNEGIHAISAGAGRANSFGSFALTAAGHLSTIDQGHQRWAFNFDTFTGQTWELSPFDSTCRPSPVFVSQSEFIAFGCHNTANPQVLGGFNMRGDEMWQQGLFGDYLAPYLVFSPASGRFALGRILSTIPFANTLQTLEPEMVGSQSVVIYQAESGKQILKAECSPAEVAGQNFALSPDGLEFGVISDGAIEIYKLPALTSKEQAAVKLAQASSPKPTALPVNLETGTPASSNPAKDEATTQPAATPSTPSTPPATTDATTDQPTDQPRKPPTLYTLPTDPPHDQRTK